MADKKISELVEATVLADTDVFPVVDSGASATKRVTFDTLATEVRTNAEPLTATTIAVSDGGTIGSASDADAMTVASNGEVTFSQNIKMAAGKGIDFSANANAAGMTSEVLDDYEEGTWTPTYTTSGTALTSVTYDATTGGTYTRIGRVVHFQCAIGTDAVTIGSASGVLRVSGLPLSKASGPGDSEYVSITIGYSSDFAGENPSAGLMLSGNTIRLYYRSSADGASTTSSPADMGTGTNSNYVYLTGFYFTDA